MNHRIITITFSPCIDKSTSVQALIPDKKLKCTNPMLDPGGGGINVARAIIKLGGEATAIFPSGGYSGKYFNQLMEKENIPVIIINTVNETRENFIVLDEKNMNQYRFGMPGTTLTEKEWVQCLEAVNSANNPEFIVASGSLPPGVPSDIYARIAKIAVKKKAKFIVDSSGEALKHAVEGGVYLLKPNLGELGALAGQADLELQEAEDIARGIIEKGNCEVIVVSMGAKGALLITKNSTEMIPTPPVTRKSTVGAGDSMVAGIVFYLAGGKNIAEAVKYGVACGTAATLNPGTELCRKEDVERLYTEIIKSKILEL